jgi:cell division protein FtsW
MDKTFQADMAKIAVASVGVFGKGPGNSTQRNLLPHPYSDFIYAIIIEEWGFLGGLAVLMLYVWFFTRCIMLSKSCTTTFSSMMVIGLSILITSQALLHICVNVGLLPVTGHTLPLISLGGTSLIIMSGAFGMILSVSRTIENVKSKEELPQNEDNNESKK